MIPYTPYTRRSIRQAGPAAASRRAATSPSAVAGGPDLQTQFEELLDAVWTAEDDWRFNDRLDMALKTRRDPLDRP